MATKSNLPAWLKPKTPPRNVAVSVAWYTEDEWQKVKAAATDAERFEATYPEWVNMAEDSLKELHATGVMAQKHYVDAETLLAWCLAHDRKNDCPARAQFVSEQAQRQSESGA